MPVFEYRCKDCGHITEFLEKPDSKGQHVCEKCGSKRLEKIFSTFAARSGDSGSSNSSGSSSCPTGTCPFS